jgi:hypothetical protein
MLPIMLVFLSLSVSFCLFQSLSVSFFLLIYNIKLAKYKHSSLFQLIASATVKKFYNVDFLSAATLLNLVWSFAIVFLERARCKFNYTFLNSSFSSGKIS